MEYIDKSQELIIRISEDDEAAFNTLFQLYHKRIYSFAFKLLNSTVEAEEVVQNVFLALWNQRKNLNISVSITSYLFGIARHQAYDFIRQKINHESYAEYFLEQNDDYAFVTEDVVVYNELENKIRHYIGMLPDRRREIFLLSRMEKMSYKDIAEKLSISENTVDTQIRHALNFLRRQLVDYFILLLSLFALK